MHLRGSWTRSASLAPSVITGDDSQTGRGMRRRRQREVTITMADQIDKTNKSFLDLSYNRRRFLQGTVAAGGAVALTGGLSGKLGPTAAWAQDLPRNETMYIGGQQWGPVTTFNPLNPSPSWPTDPDQLYLFETLFAFNLATGALEPCLAKELVETPETFTITLQDGTMWHDGTPLTANDVVYSYTLAKNH